MVEENNEHIKEKVAEEDNCRLVEATSIASGSGTAIDTVSEFELALPERYEVIRLIGRGGMSLVYEVMDRQRNDIRLALKVLDRSYARDEQIVKRFLRESQVVEKLDHPNIVKVLDSGTTADGIPFLELEYIEGISLSELLERQNRLSAYDACKIALQIAAALEHAHSNRVTHRDLKPANVLLVPDDDEYFVKVVDFGIARTIERDLTNTAGLTRTGDIFGSPAYMSPEQCTGGDPDTRSDIYSLGCILYEMLTGRNPFASDNPIKSILKHVEEKPEPFELDFKHLEISGKLEKAVLICLEKDAKDRYQRPEALRRELERLTGESDEAVLLTVLRRFGASCIDLMIFMFLFLGTHSVNAFIIVVLMFPVYCAILESSPLQATIGKKLMGLWVREKDGKPTTILATLLRFAMPLSIIAMTFRTIDLVSLYKDLNTPGELYGLFVLTCLAGAMVVSLYVLWVKGARVSLRPAVLKEKPRLRPLHLALNRKQILQLTCSVLLAVAFFTTTGYRNDLERQALALPTTKTATVLYSNRYIPEGEMITADSVKVVRIRAAKTPLDAVAGLDEVVGKRLKYGLFKGQIISRHDLGPEQP